MRCLPERPTRQRRQAVRADVVEGAPVALLVAPHHQVPPEHRDGMRPAGLMSFRFLS